MKINSVIAERCPGRLQNAPTGVILMVGTVSNGADAVRLQTAPTGPRGNIELPIYFLKRHETAPTGERRCLFIFRIHYNLNART